MGKYIQTLLLLFFVPAVMVYAQQYELNKNWYCKKAADISQKGEDISVTTFSTKGWLPATVPGTVLTTLLDNQKIPDPFYGMNNELIPDIYTVGPDYYTYWFVTDFKETVEKSQQAYLTFRGINYSCDIFLNGHKLNAQLVGGMFLRHRYNITSYLARNGMNRLAVIVHPPDPPGNPNGGQGGDGTIAKSLTSQYTAGWDWIQPIRDRNTGIWDKVFIDKTGPVSVHSTHVVTQVPGRRMPYGSQQPAHLSVTAELENADSKEIKGALVCTIEGKETSVSVTLKGREKKQVPLPVITIPNPRLWWPNGYGKPELYEMSVRFVIDGKAVSGEERLAIGIRELKTQWNAHTQSRELYVNGQRIFIKGGNRILSDAMLRFSPERYDAEIKYHRDMNLNFIRVWGGGITERPEFYDACDKYGLLVMQDFWVSGDCNGRWYDALKLEDTIARRQYPADHSLFVAACADQVKLLRNHPSLAYWCGGNEIKPPADILTPLRDSILPALDGTRFFFEYSNDDSMSLDAHDGPYTIQRDNYFWEHRSWGFNSEIGSVGIGDTESLNRFIPSEHMVVPWYDAVKKKWITDSVWQYHKFYSYDSSVEKYGHPHDIADFAMKAQMVNYNQYRALIESFAARMWDWYTGVIIWKTQNPWTAMVGQMYDVYLDPNACLYGLAEGAKPTHIIFNPLTQAPIIVNTDPTADSFKLLVKAIDAAGKQHIIYRGRTLTGMVKADAQYELPTLADTLSKAEYKDGYFLLLFLSSITHGEHKVDENFYWMPDKNGDYTTLLNMPKAKVNVRAIRTADDTIVVQLMNSRAGSLAFFNRISLVDSKTQKRILPAFCNNNYISVLPGGVQQVTVTYKPQNGIIPEICIEGWNVERQYFSITELKGKAK